MALFEQLLGYMLLGSLSYAGGGGSGNQTTSMAAISLVAEGFICLGCKLLANANRDQSAVRGEGETQHRREEDTQADGIR